MVVVLFSGGDQEVPPVAGRTRGWVSLVGPSQRADLAQTGMGSGKTREDETGREKVMRDDVRRAAETRVCIEQQRPGSV